MSVFSSNGLKLSTVIANHPQNLHFPAKTQMQMCWHSKFPWLGLVPPYMTHLVPARRANLLLAGSSFHISTVSQETILGETAWKWLYFHCSKAFAFPVWHFHERNGLKVPCSSRLSISTASYLVWAKDYTFTIFEGRALPVTRVHTVGSDCPRGRNMCDFSCCPLVLCCAVCHVSSFSCLLNNWMRCKSECWTVSSNMGSRSGWLRNCSKHCQPSQDSIKTRIVLEPCKWLPDFKGHWSFCLLEGTADIKHCDGRLRVLGTAGLFGRAAVGFFAAWCHLARKHKGSLMVVLFRKGKVIRAVSESGSARIVPKLCEG